MGVLKEISQAVNMLEKKSSGFGDFFDPALVPHDDSVIKAKDAAQAHIARGALKGLKEVVPQSLDLAVGLPLSFGSGIGNAIYGDGSFYDGFKQTGKAWEDYVTNPIRNLEMRAGGNYIADKTRKIVDDMDRAAYGDKPNTMGKNLEGISSGVTTLAATWPLFTKNTGAVNKVINSVSRVGSKIPVAGKALGKAIKPYLWSAYTYYGMNGPDIKEGLKDKFSDNVDPNDVHNAVDTLTSMPKVRPGDPDYDEMVDYYRRLQAFDRFMTTDDKEKFEESAFRNGYNIPMIVR